MTTEPNAGDGPTPPVDPAPNAQQSTAPDPAADGRRPAGSGFFDSIRRSGLYRADQRWVGGVAAGIAGRLGWDPLLVRGLLILSFFLGGIGMIVYAVGWALMPEESDGRIHLEQAIAGHFDVALFGAAVVLLVGFAWGGPWEWGFHGSGSWFAGLFWLLVAAGLVYLVVRVAKRRPSVEGEPHALPYPTQPYPAQQYPAQQGPGQQGPGQQPVQPVQPVQRQGYGPAYQGPHYPVAPHVASGPHVAGGAGQPSAYANAPSAQPAPPRPPRPPKGGGGGIVVGLILLLGALCLAAEGLGLYLPFDVNLGSAWIGLSLIIIGIAIVIAGLRGRSSGGLGALGILGLVVGLPVAAAFSAPFITQQSEVALNAVHGLVENDPERLISGGTVNPHDPERAAHGYEVQLGSPTIDLTNLDLSRDAELGDQIEIPIEVNAGYTTIIVPADQPVEVDADLSAGTVEWHVDGQNQTATGPSGEAYFATDDISDRSQDNVMIRLKLDVTAGAVSIEEEK